MVQNTVVVLYPGSILGSTLFDIFIDDLDDGAEGKVSKFADDVRSSGVTDTPAGCATLQMDLNQLEKWVDRNLTKFNGKYKALHRGQLHSTHATSNTCYEAALQRRTQGSSWTAS